MFGTKLREWRKEAGIKREQLAVLADVGVKTIEFWELGKSEPRVSQVLAWEERWPGCLQALGIVGSDG